VVNAYDVETGQLIKAAAEELKSNKEIVPPAWASFAKTGSHKERVPHQKDWWYFRTAALLRRVYTRPIGVSRLRTVYGGRKRRGVAPARFRRAGGSVLRKALQQLEKAGYVKKGKKGREITPKGRKFLDNLAARVAKQGGAVSESHAEA